MTIVAPMSSGITSAKTDTVPSARRSPKCAGSKRASASYFLSPYFHCVFTLPHALNSLAQGNPRLLYGLLFQTASATLQTFGRDPKWLGGELGITMVLHTWSQTLEHHIHVHCVVTGGALAPDHSRWIPTARRDFLFPVTALSRVFRGKYLAALQAVYRQGRLQCAGYYGGIPC